MHEMRQDLPAAGQTLFHHQGQSMPERSGRKNRHQSLNKVMILALREM
jgi:hypothetical protein